MFRRTFVSASAMLLTLWSHAAADNIPYGSDTGDYVGDDICDDPRFMGPKVEADQDWTSAGQDASDCKAAVKAGATFWYDPNLISVVDCKVTDFGDDSGDGALDGYCDDNRFYGLTMGMSFSSDDFRDATDCKRACEAGTIFSRPSDAKY